MTLFSQNAGQNSTFSEFLDCEITRLNGQLKPSTVLSFHKMIPLSLFFIFVLYSLFFVQSTELIVQQGYAYFQILFIINNIVFFLCLIVFETA